MVLRGQPCRVGGGTGAAPFRALGAIPVELTEGPDRHALDFY